MPCPRLYTSCWKASLILHLKSLTTIVEPSENDQRKQEHEGCHSQPCRWPAGGDKAKQKRGHRAAAAPLGAWRG